MIEYEPGTTLDIEGTLDDTDALLVTVDTDGIPTGSRTGTTPT